MLCTKQLRIIKKNEMELISKEEVIRILKRNQMHSLKRLGQHFLISKDILTEIIKNANIQKGDKVIEAGPGLGVLTEELLSNGAEVTAIEFDSRMMRILKKRFKNYQNLNLIKGDALDEIPRLNLANQKIVANLPYQITSPFFRKALSQKNLPKMIVVMVQKEMAERIVALPHNSKRGFLSVLVQLYGKPEIVRIVSRDCFYPEPKVESAILKLKVQKPKFQPKKEKLLKIIQAGFSQKRKKIRNSIAASLRIEALKAEKMIKDSGIDPDKRAEDLEIEEWQMLTKIFFMIL